MTGRKEAEWPEWTPALAECVARACGIAALSESHWRVISECREEWARSGSVPELERLAAISRLSVPELEALFPAGLLSLAWILSGMTPPPPAGKTAMHEAKPVSESDSLRSHEKTS